jgi:Ricin-type beta-trefoil lectin domain-like
MPISVDDAIVQINALASPLLTPLARYDFLIATLSTRRVHSPPPDSGPRPKPGPEEWDLLPDMPPLTAVYSHALQLMLSFRGPAGYSLQVGFKTGGIEQARRSYTFANGQADVPIGQNFDGISWSAQNHDGSIGSGEYELTINWLIAAFGIGTLPCVPLAVIYDAPQVAGHTTPNTINFTQSASASTKITFSFSSSHNDTVPVTSNALGDLKKIVDGGAAFAKSLGTIVGGSSGDMPVPGAGVAKTPGFDDYASAIGNGLAAVSQVVTTLAGSVTITPVSGVKIDQSSTQGMTVSWTNMTRPLGALGLGRGDLIYYLIENKILWLAYRGQINITLLKAQWFSRQVPDLEAALGRVAGTNQIDPLTGLNADTANALLALDPFIASGQNLDFSDPALSRRFVEMDPHGPTNVGGGQMQVYRFTVTLSTESVQSTTITHGTTETDQAGLLQKLGIDVGVAQDRTVTTSVANGTTLTAGTQTTLDEALAIYAEQPEPLVVKSYYDSSFGTAAYLWLISGLFKIVSRATGKVLDVPDSNPDDHVKIQQFSDTGGSNQQWYVVPKEGTFYKISSRATGKVLDLPDGSANDGVQIQQYTENAGSSPNQEWQIVPVDGEWVKIVSRASKKVLDVPGADARDHVVIQQFTDHGGANQQWRLVSLLNVP